MSIPQFYSVLILSKIEVSRLSNYDKIIHAMGFKLVSPFKPTGDQPAARDLNFELAAEIRDKIKEIEEN